MKKCKKEKEWIISIHIPNDIDDNTKYEIEKMTDDFNSKLGQLNDSIYMTDKYTDDNEDNEDENDSYQKELMEDFIDDECGRDEKLYKILNQDDKIVKKIYEQIESDAGIGRWRCDGVYVNLEPFYAVKWKDESNVWKIRIFAHVEAGIQDENGSTSDEWDTVSDWTTDGRFIELV